MHHRLRRPGACHAHAALRPAGRALPASQTVSRLPQPLETCTDPETGKQFLLCDYNRDADFYRCGRQPQQTQAALLLAAAAAAAMRVR